MEIPIRVAVTGSRGKSGVVRLIHAALCSCGLNSYARITGVIPRELTPHAQKFILRSGAANVSEMKWWLSSLPEDAEAVVLENSAVSTELQGICPCLLRPHVTVLTNIRPDHKAFWGPGEADVLHALEPALPVGETVVLPSVISRMPALLSLSGRKSLRLLPAPGIQGFPAHLSANIGLAMEVVRFFGLDERISFEAMRHLDPDVADFSVLEIGEGRLAFAFSANDVQSTEELFLSTGWKRESTGIIFNHRSDRQDRFRAFEDWMTRNPWKCVVITGDRLPRTGLDYEYFRCNDPDTLEDRLSEGLWLGCGNVVHGPVLELKIRHDERNLMP